MAIIIKQNKCITANTLTDHNYNVNNSLAVRHYSVDFSEQLDTESCGGILYFKVAKENKIDNAIILFDTNVIKADVTVHFMFEPMKQIDNKSYIPPYVVLRSKIEYKNVHEQTTFTHLGNSLTYTTMRPIPHSKASIARYAKIATLDELPVSVDELAQAHRLSLFESSTFTLLGNAFVQDHTLRALIASVTTKCAELSTLFDTRMMLDQRNHTREGAN